MTARTIFPTIFTCGLLVVVACSKATESTGTRLGELKANEGPPPASCREDKECQVVDIPVCCACCPGMGMAPVSNTAPKYTRDCPKCATCVGTKDCATAPKPSDFKAVCKSGTCALDRVTPLPQ